MTDFFLKLPVADIPDPLPSSQTVQAAEVWNDGADQIAYQYTTDAVDPLPDWPVGTSILAAWDGDLQLGQTYDGAGDVIGTPTYAIQPEYNIFVRELGNADGRATGPIRAIRWQGHPEERYEVAVSTTNRSEYPSDNLPYQLEIERQDLTGGPFPGWGWVVKMVQNDPNRVITNRAIWIYTDPDFNNFSYTTGAFIDDGKYGPGVFYTECPEGQRTGSPDPVYFELHEASNPPEGQFALIDPADGATADALFWKQNWVPGAEWAVGVSYVIGNNVFYLGIEYTCIQAHTSQVGWEPPNVPALWAVV